MLDENEMKRRTDAEKYKLMKTRDIAEEKIYEIIQTKFSKSNRSESSGLDYEHPSRNIFKSRFVKRCKENKI